MPNKTPVATTVTPVQEHAAARIPTLGGRRLPPALLTLEMVADRLAISLRSVRRLIDGNELPVHHIGGTRRVSEDDLARYLAGTRRS